MVEAHEVENGGVEVVYARAIVHGLKAKLIAGAVAHAGLYACAGHEAGERTGIVIPSRPVALQERHATKLVAHTTSV